MGTWFAWSDSFKPLAEDVSFEEMKRVVTDAHANGDVNAYGENNDNGEIWPVVVW